MIAISLARFDRSYEIQFSLCRAYHTTSRFVTGLRTRSSSVRYVAILATGLTPAQEFIFIDTHIRETMSAAAHIAVLTGRIAKDKSVWRNISCHYRPCPYKGKLPNGHT